MSTTSSSFPLLRSGRVQPEPAHFTIKVLGHISSMMQLSALTGAQARKLILGGYRSMTLTPELKALLFKAIGKDAYYTVPDRVCVTWVQSVSSQVVSGTNYKFVILGCDVLKALQRQSMATTSSAQQYLGTCGKTVIAGCTPQTITITVYEQLWTNTLQVTKVEYAA